MTWGYLATLPDAGWPLSLLSALPLAVRHRPKGLPLSLHSDVSLYANSMWTWAPQAPTAEPSTYSGTSVSLGDLWGLILYL